MQIKGCPAWRDYDVFGLPTVNGCCYSYMKFCKDVETCPVKEIIKKCKDNGLVESKDILSILYKGGL